MYSKPCFSCDPQNLKTVLQMFSLRRISFSTAIPSLNVFAISAREPGQSHSDQYAHVFRTDQAEEINQIVGQAFKQAYTLEKHTKETPTTGAETKISDQNPENSKKLKNLEKIEKSNNNLLEPKNTKIQSQSESAIPESAISESAHPESTIPESDEKPNYNTGEQFEAKIMSQLFANKKPSQTQQASKNSFKRQSLPVGASLRDASNEFMMGARNANNNSPAQNSHSRQNSGGITYAYSTSGSSKQKYETSGYESHSLSSNSSQGQKSLEKGNLLAVSGQNSSLGKNSSKNAQKPNPSSLERKSSVKILPQSQWHQPDLHPDTARDLLIKMPMGCYFVVGSHSPLNLMIRGEKQIWQIGIVVTNKGYHLLLTNKQRRDLQHGTVPVFGTLPALVFHYTNLEPGESPLPTQLMRNGVVQQMMKLN